MKTQQLLMVEDSLSMAAVYKAYLAETDYRVRIVTDLSGARAEIGRQTPDIVMLDVDLPDGNGLDLLKEIKHAELPVEVIVMTAHGSSEMAVKAIEDGAFDFLTKPFDASRLTVTLDNARRHRELNRRVAAYSEFDRDRYCNFIGQSLAMQAVYRVIDSLAASTATAFIIGESGTGKELAAEAIHLKSDRADKNFHAINCGAIPSELMESELFGHVKGSFTGATSDRDGAAALAHGGTLFLDEICEMELELQKKLLRFLQTGTYQKVGSNKVETVDIRFVCATNKNPLEEVRAGRFREDLYYRLHVVPLNLPPLRERDEDIELLARYFLHRFAERDGKEFEDFSEDALLAIRSYKWPGNVRELENAIQNTVVLNRAKRVERAMLPPAILGIGVPAPSITSETPAALVATGSFSEAQSLPSRIQEIKPLWLTEKETIQRAIDLCGGSINRAAGKLEVAPSTLYRKIQHWNEIVEEVG